MEAPDPCPSNELLGYFKCPAGAFRHERAILKCPAGANLALSGWRKKTRSKGSRSVWNAWPWGDSSSPPNRLCCRCCARRPGASGRPRRRNKRSRNPTADDSSRQQVVPAARHDNSPRFQPGLRAAKFTLSPAETTEAVPHGPAYTKVAVTGAWSGTTPPAVGWAPIMLGVSSFRMLRVGT